MTTIEIQEMLTLSDTGHYTAEMLAFKFQTTIQTIKKTCYDHDVAIRGRIPSVHIPKVKSANLDGVKYKDLLFEKKNQGRNYKDYLKSHGLYEKTQETLRWLRYM